jgi:pimeloyl-ACP methyl ester carboxylesterase
MKALRFGLGTRELVGMLHGPADDGARRFGVLICPPFGQEGVRTHRLLRVLADRLVRDGFHVLRFDYYGTGESMGDDEEATLEGSVRDVLLAAAELEHHAACVRSVWIGLRLGGSAALLAAASTARPPDRLVLCDPVLYGTAYLQVLQDAHRETRRTSYSLRAWQPPDEAGGTLDAIGFAFGAAMQRELQALRADPVAPRPVRETSVVTTPPAPGCPVPVLAGATAVALHEPFAWTSEEAINTALVPADLVAALRREACAVR